MYQGTTEEIARDLLAQGFAHPEIEASQPNLASLWVDEGNGEYREGEACNYNCISTDEKGNPTGNDYDCDGAAVRNQGMKIQSMAPAEEITQRLEMIFEAQHNVWTKWVQSPSFNMLMERLQVSDSIAAGFKLPIAQSKKDSRKKVANFFGGNTELYRELDAMFEWAAKNGVSYNLTTVGQRIAKDKSGTFVNMLRRNPPAVFAFSFDHIESVQDLEWVLGLTEAQLIEEHDKQGQLQGPRRKLLMGVAATRRILRETGFEKSRILYNVVFKHSNVRHLIAMAKAVHAVFPTVIFNPYPSQSSPYNMKAIFTHDDLPFIYGIIDWAMDEHDRPQGRFIPARYHFWQLLEAAKRRWHNDKDQQCRAYSGYDLWRCYENVGAGFYTQMGVTGETYGTVQIGNAVTTALPPWQTGVWPGLKLACYWNRRTVSDLVRIQSVKQVEGYLSGGMAQLAAQTPAADRCPSCLMGRLMGGALSTWAGIPNDQPELVKVNIAVRKERVGW